MQIGKGGAKSDTPFDTLNRENAYLHEKVWVENTASFIEKTWKMS
jgi:hypothetical protein